jgi:hypothetical protein
LCNLVWYWLSRNADEAGRARLQAALLRPLPGRTRRVSRELVEHERDMFKRALGKLGGS